MINSTKENDIRTHFVEYVKCCMAEMDIRMWYVAYYSEICEATLRKYLKDAKLPSPTVLIKMADLFECSVNDILGYEHFEGKPLTQPFDSGRDTSRVGQYFVFEVTNRMKENRMCFSDLAAYSFTPEVKLYKCLNTCILPDTLTILRLADALDCTPSDLLGY